METFTAPPGSLSTASSGDDYFRSFLSSFATGISPSYIWPGSGGGSNASAGVSQFGNARCAVAGNSAVTGGYNDGYLLLNQHHISLHHIGSHITAMLGHSGMIDHGVTTGSWSVQSGVFSIVSSSADSLFGSKTVTFSPAYTTTPAFLQIQASPFGGYAVSLSTLTTGGFTSNYSSLRVAGGSNASVFWESEGTL